MRHEQWRQSLGLTVLVAILAGTVTWLRPAATAQAQDTGELWGQPVNLSASGAASHPSIVASPDGTLHALWWDPFDGTKYASYSAENGWSTVVSVRSIAGGRRTTGEYIPPQNLVFLADGARYLHAFWIADDGDLMYARKRIGFGDWTTGLQIATAPLAWDVTLDSRNWLHLALIPLPRSATCPLAFITASRTPTAARGGRRFW
jgi:hypothetical protein